MREPLEVALHADTLQEPEEGLARGVLQLTQGGDKQSQGLGEEGKEGRVDGVEEMSIRKGRRREGGREGGREGSGVKRGGVPDCQRPADSSPGWPRLGGGGRRPQGGSSGPQRRRPRRPGPGGGKK